MFTCDPWHPELLSSYILTSWSCLVWSVSLQYLWHSCSLNPWLQVSNNMVSWVSSGRVRGCCHHRKEDIRASSRRWVFPGTTSQHFCYDLVTEVSLVPGTPGCHRESSWGRWFAWQTRSLWEQHDLLCQEEYSQASDLWRKNNQIQISLNR